jgi:hypothetical protein
MTDDVVRLAHQLVRGKAGGGDEVVVEVGQPTLGVGPGNDQRFIGDGVFDVGNGQVLAHCSSPEK